MTLFPRLPLMPRVRRTGGSPLAVLHAAVALALLVAAAPARASFTIDFETNPSLPAQPNNFAAAGAMQTYSDLGPNGFTISGGVVLGNPTFLAAYPAHGSP